MIPTNFNGMGEMVAAIGVGDGQSSEGFMIIHL